MTDRELLELAAKAAGYEFTYGATPLIRCYESEFPDKQYNIWNPLDDDGDALRLAVKLSIFSDYGLSIHLADEDDRNVVVSKLKVYVREDIDNDPYASTRRAIVRAAAEIGKQS